MLAAVGIALWGCADAPPVQRIALLAPFEGRYRELGYNAWYAARLAFAEPGGPGAELLAVDDGGTPEAARVAARALAADPSVSAAVVLGYDAASAADALADIPRIVVGEWGAPDHSLSFHLSARALSQAITLPAGISVTDAAAAPAPFTGGEVVGLEGFARLRSDWRGVVLLTSGAPADAAYRAQYTALGPYTPQPNHLAALTTDAFRFLLSLGPRSRADTAAALEQMSFAGHAGAIRFVDGWWESAPVNRWTRDSAGLIAAP